MGTRATGEAYAGGVATAKVTRDAGGTTVVLTAGDWKAEFARDADGKTYMVQRAYDGALVKRHPVPAEAWREVLEAAQGYAAAENAVSRAIKSTWKIGR